MSRRNKFLSSFPARDFHFGLQPAPAWIVILGFVLLSSLFLIIHLGSLLRLTFPAGALAVSIFLYWRYPILYLGFTWWLWFLTPWVRRLVDYQIGWAEPNPVLLAPFLATAVTLATFLRFLPKSYHLGGLPFVLAFVGAFYGFLVGLIFNPITAAIVAALQWIPPILFSFHLFINWQDYPKYRQNMQRTFLWGVLVTGAYGVLQYLVVPEWDRFWLINALEPGNQTFGIPEPLGIRVFSTMNSPQPFAMAMMAGLLLLFTGQGSLRFPAAAVGYLAFLLSLARSAWLGWCVGFLTLITSLNPRLQMRLFITILVMAVFILPLTSISPFSEIISSRLQTLANVNQDGSYRDRVSQYNNVFALALTELLGKGLGIVDKNYSDSGVLDIFFSLGWFGTIFYLGGILLLLLNLVQYSRCWLDPFASAARAISLATFVQIGVNSVVGGVFAMVLWGFLGMVMAARNYYQHQSTAEP